MRFVLLKADDSISFVQIAPAPGVLKILQALVGGLIEIVYYQGNQVMIVNENGYSLGLPVNKTATELIGNKKVQILGDVLLADKETFIEWDRNCEV